VSGVRAAETMPPFCSGPHKTSSSAAPRARAAHTHLHRKRPSEKVEEDAPLVEDDPTCRHSIEGVADEPPAESSSLRPALFAVGLLSGVLGMAIGAACTWVVLRRGTEHDATALTTRAPASLPTRVPSTTSTTSFAPPPPSAVISKTSSSMRHRHRPPPAPHRASTLVAVRQQHELSPPSPPPWQPISPRCAPRCSSNDSSSVRWVVKCRVWPAYESTVTHRPRLHLHSSYCWRVHWVYGVCRHECGTCIPCKTGRGAALMYESNVYLRYQWADAAGAPRSLTLCACEKCGTTSLFGALHEAILGRRFAVRMPGVMVQECATTAQQSTLPSRPGSTPRVLVPRAHARSQSGARAYVHAHSKLHPHRAG
jgi:hypothetical protein